MAKVWFRGPASKAVSCATRTPRQPVGGLLARGASLFGADSPHRATFWMTWLKSLQARAPREGPKAFEQRTTIETQATYHDPSEKTARTPGQASRLASHS
jgi:hypothetical protein